MAAPGRPGMVLSTDKIGGGDQKISILFIGAEIFTIARSACAWPAGLPGVVCLRVLFRKELSVVGPV